MLNHPEATAQAMNLVRSGDHFSWYVIPLFIFVLYIYADLWERKDFRAIAAGLSLYMVHWFVEIVNALIQHFSGHALWTVPSGTALSLLVGVGVEINLMFAIAGIVAVKMMPKDAEQKVLGMNNRLVFSVVNAGLAAILEIFLVQTPTFVWVYPWWGALPVFITVYVPFFAAACYGYHWKPRTQKIFIGGLFTFNALALLIFAGILGWI